MADKLITDYREKTSYQESNSYTCNFLKKIMDFSPQDAEKSTT